MIDPNIITTVRVGELPPSDFNLTDNIPHEIGTELYKGTVQQLADKIGDYLGTSDSLAFNPNTIPDGGALPATTSNEWMLVGKGTFINVGGGANIVTTEELNAITSNGTYWSLAVEIPINVELSGIVQTIRSGYTQTAPSEDAVYNALSLKLNVSDLPLPTLILPPKLKSVGDGIASTFNIATTATVKQVFYNSVIQDNDVWTQSGSDIILTFVPENGALIQYV